MRKKRTNAEAILRHLREMDVLPSQGKKVAECVCGTNSDGPAQTRDQRSEVRPDRDEKERPADGAYASSEGITSCIS